VIRQAPAGLAGAFAAAIEASAPRLRRYFLRRAPAAEVDDLIQEVFLRVQVHDAITHIGHLSGYLFTVAASVLSDRARRRTVRHGAAHLPLEEQHHPTEALTPERLLLDREALDIVVNAIVDLPPRTRDVFVLHRFEDMSCNEIAVSLGITVSGVEKHIMKALRQLRNKLGGQ
jgi:RNA polymerase sigma factor (sigma-70 family)